MDGIIADVELQEYTASTRSIFADSEYTASIRSLFADVEYTNILRLRDASD